MANLMQSSELERGAHGRTRALSLRNTAQATLEASCNAQALDFTLAEAALVGRLHHCGVLDMLTNPLYDTDSCTLRVLMSPAI